MRTTRSYLKDQYLRDYKKYYAPDYREQAKKALADWFSKKMDEMVFEQITIGEVIEHEQKLVHKQGQSRSS